MSEEQVAVPDAKQDIVETANEKQSVEQVPYSRFKDLIDEKNSLKVELESLNREAMKQAEDRKLKDMESKGEYEKIMADMTSKLSAAESKAQAFDEYQASRRESLLSKLPEEDRTVYDGLSLDKLEVHVEKVNAKPSPASVDNSNPSTSEGYSSFEEWASVDPAGYKKANNTQSSGKIKIGYGD